MSDKIVNGPFSRGFSLIELIVVVAIVGILAALLLCALANAKARQQRVQCIGNSHQLGIALQTILSNNHGYPLVTENRYSSWFNQFEVEGFGISAASPEFLESGVWRCPSAQWPVGDSGIHFSYGYNAYGSLRIGNRENSPGLFGHFAPLSDRCTPITESEVIVPSDMIAIGESAHYEFMRSQRYDFYKTPVRHQSKVNILLCDGHVESALAQSLFAETNDSALSRWNRDHQPHREGL